METFGPAENSFASATLPQLLVLEAGGPGSGRTPEYGPAHGRGNVYRSPEAVNESKRKATMRVGSKHGYRASRYGRVGSNFMEKTGPVDGQPAYVGEYKAGIEVSHDGSWKHYTKESGSKTIAQGTNAASLNSHLKSSSVKASAADDKDNLPLMGDRKIGQPGSDEDPFDIEVDDGYYVSSAALKRKKNTAKEPKWSASSKKKEKLDAMHRGMLKTRLQYSHSGTLPGTGITSHTYKTKSGKMVGHIIERPDGNHESSVSMKHMMEAGGLGSGRRVTGSTDEWKKNGGLKHVGVYVSDKAHGYVERK